MNKYIREIQKIYFIEASHRELSSGVPYRIEQSYKKAKIKVPGFWLEWKQVVTRARPDRKAGDNGR